MVSVCVVDGCDKPKRKRGWCDRHYQAWRRHGDPTVAKYNWSSPTKECAACGKPGIAPGMRKFCSGACRQSAYRAIQKAHNKSGTMVKRATHCVSCGTPLLSGRVDGRELYKSTRRRCTECASRPRRSYRLAVHILAHYQGTDCGICGETVDLSLRHPHRLSASIDHIVPLALGGTDEVANLRLAHLGCNCQRDGFFALATDEAAE